MSRIVIWIIKLTMTMFIAIASLKQCIRPVITAEGFFVTGISMSRLCLNDTANENRIYYMVKYDGYTTYRLAYKAIFQGPRPRWKTPLNDIDGISVCDSTQRDISDNLCFYKGSYGIRSVNEPDSTISFDSMDNNMNSRNERMKKKSNFSVDIFVFYVDKSDPQPYEIRMRLDSTEIRSRVMMDTMQWILK